MLWEKWNIGQCAHCLGIMVLPDFNGQYSENYTLPGPCKIAQCSLGNANYEIYKEL